MPLTYFNNYASLYDEHFSDTLIGNAQRSRVHDYLVTLNLKEKVGLELNCGTGKDAVFLANRCKRIVCTDISTSMMEITNGKTSSLKNVSVLNSSIQEVHTNTSEVFDFVFSNFGGLNCLSKEELLSVTQKSLSFTHANSDLLFVIMSKKCIWEKVYFACKGNIKNALRRRSGNCTVKENDKHEFPVYYYSPAEIQDIFSPNYTIERCLPVGLFVPPSYLNIFFNKRKFLFSVLLKLDNIFSKVSLFSDYADHYLIHLKRK
ncbi:MAG: class SAM-dependent methyltransferase [Bacteroidetes bacterium]|nr:class SAM-dependent methyltransferase [Bacteroidota bacterium]